MSFFPPRWESDEALLPDPGWAAYVCEPALEAKVAPAQVATDLLLADTDRARILIPTVDVYDDCVTFEVRSELHEIRDGLALSAFLDERMAEESENRRTSPPSDSLLVGLELNDGTRLYTYPTGPAGGGALRLQTVGGGASGERNTSASLRQTFVVRGGVPVQPFHIVGSFVAVGIAEVSVTV